MSKLTITLSKEVDIPPATKIIRNDGEFLTLARKMRTNIIAVITIHVNSVDVIDLHNESNWVEYTREEINAIHKLKF